MKQFHKHLYIIALFFSICLIGMGMITVNWKKLKTENTKLKEELLSYQHAELQRKYLEAERLQAKIAADPAYQKLTEYQYSEIKWAFENAPIGMQMLIVQKFSSIKKYGDFLAEPLDVQIKIVKEFTEVLRIPEKYRSIFLQKQFYVNAAIAEKIVEYN